MKIILKYLIAATAAALTLTLTSCQLSKLMPEKTENPAADQTTSALPGTTTAAFDLKTEDMSKYVTLGNYRGIAVTEKVTPLTDEEFETALQSYINGITAYEKVTNRPAAKGDTVIMDYVGKLDGVAFAGGTAQGKSIELSENSGYIDGFADGLIGVTPGSTVDLTLTFPTDYHSADMAGKTVVFTVTVHYIQGEKITPTLTDAFISEYTEGEFTTAEAFRTYYREYLNAEAAQKAHDTAMAELWSAVFEGCTFHSVPAEQVDFYYNQSKAQYESYASAYGMAYETILSMMGLTDEALRSQSEQYAKQDLVFYALVRAEGLSVTAEEYTAGVAEYAANAGASATELESYYGKDYLMESLLWDEMMDMLYRNAVVEK